MADGAAASASGSVGDTLSNGREGHGKRLSQQAQRLMLQLDEAGKSHAEIAQVLGCSVSSVSRGLSVLSDYRHLARRQLEAGAPRLVRTVLRSKDAATALRTLTKLDVVREDATPGGANVVIAIGQPGQPLTPPVILTRASLRARDEDETR